MTVGELRAALAALRDDMPICVEVTFGEDDDIEGADLQDLDVEIRCDDVERLYLWGIQSESEPAPESE